MKSDDLELSGFQSSVTYSYDDFDRARLCIFTCLDHSFRYSSSLKKTCKNYYDSKAEIPEGYRMSTAAEELAIQLDLERAGQDPGEATVFKEIFGREKPFCQWTETALRVPKRSTPRYNPTNPDYEDSQGREYWIREVLHGDKVVGEIFVPKGDTLSVVEWDEVFGIPRVTDIRRRNSIDFRIPTTHFYFEANPPVDERTGRQDVAVCRGAGWEVGDDYGGINVHARHGRCLVDSDSGFRRVQGPVPEIVKLIASDRELFEVKFLTEMREDFSKMPSREFQEKYRL